MKRVLFLFACMFLLAGCGDSVSKSDYDEEVNKANEYREKYEDATVQIDEYKKSNQTLETEKEDLEKQLENLQTEYSEYQEKMKEYEDLAEAEAEARQIEAQRIIDEKNAEDERKAAAEAEEAERKAKEGYDTGITYDQLARTPDDYKGEKVKFYGKVVQVVENPDVDYIHIRFAIDGDYDKMTFCEYQKNIVSQRVLEDDKITIYGTSYGLYTYESTMGGYITIPAIVVDKIDQ